MDRGLAKAIEQTGSMAELARKLCITRAAISQWRRIPAERVIPIERVTGVPRHELRPDLHPLTSPSQQEVA